MEIATYVPEPNKWFLFDNHGVALDAFIAETVEDLIRQVLDSSSKDATPE